MYYLIKSKEFAGQLFNLFKARSRTCVHNDDSDIKR